MADTERTYRVTISFDCKLTGFRNVADEQQNLIDFTFALLEGRATFPGYAPSESRSAVSVTVKRLESPPAEN